MDKSIQFSTQLWNEEFQAFRKRMSDPQARIEFLPHFLSLHQQVHPGVELPTYADSLWDGVSDTLLRMIPPGMDHSIVWCVWHISRIEDVVMNILIADKPQLFFEGDWNSMTGTRFSAIGNEMTQDEIIEFSQKVNTEHLHGYWRAVTLRTREVAANLDPASLPHQLPEERLQKLWDLGIVNEITRSVYEYWKSLTGAGLLLMPPTRHQLIHLNEMQKIMKKLRSKNH